ncbi:UNVERIFIED_CONTAM: Exocyst complex component EXO84A [Sesamum calycinum]|uniref:Exocyst complex component EXO84A n=1 Tax=Sesamum calycinum TaxID=2727403 RepID=A0AAW2PQC1_9LAMI
MENRQKLADQLAESTCQPSINGFELRSSVQAMKQLGDGPRAHTAANDSLAIFSDEPAFTSELVTWAVNQTHAFAQLVKKNVVAAPAASGCLRIVAESVHICLEHCLLLEDRGLALCPTLLKIFKPYLEQALTANLKRIELCTAAIAASDNWSLTYPPVAGRSWGGSAGTTGGSQQKLSSSAHRFNTMIQELFVKLTRLASIASDVFVGRERFATILLMRLTETVILWFSEDQNFWEELEAGQRILGPLGLQQFYLDMEFVILFSSQGRYLSRNLHQVMKNVISRAIEAVQANGIDPFSVLPEDEWFADVAQIAIKMLTGPPSFEGDRDMTSPTAKSVSSVHSHGST